MIIETIEQEQRTEESIDAIPVETPTETMERLDRDARNDALAKSRYDKLFSYDAKRWLEEADRRTPNSAGYAYHDLIKLAIDEILYPTVPILELWVQRRMRQKHLKLIKLETKLVKHIRRIGWATERLSQFTLGTCISAMRTRLRKKLNI